MKRMHVSISVESLEASVDFYTRFFDAPPDVTAQGLRQMDARRPEIEYFPS